MQLLFDKTRKLSVGKLLCQGKPFQDILANWRSLASLRLLRFAKLVVETYAGLANPWVERFFGFTNALVEEHQSPGGKL